MRKGILLFLLLFSGLFGAGQKPDTMGYLTIPEGHRAVPRNSIYFELGGQGMLISVNYERMFFHEGDFYISGRTGIGVVPGTITTLSFPLLANGIYQVTSGFMFELGLGLNLTYTSWPDYYSGGLFSGDNHKSGNFFDPLITGFAGIRTQSKKGFLFRFGFSPLAEITRDVEQRTIYKQYGTKHSFLPWIGISFGYSFK